MRRYSADEEERIRLQDAVREWTRSGLLDAAQGETLGAELRVNFRRTNPFLRAVLALFTALIVAAGVALFLTVFEVRGHFAIAAIAALASLACLGAAELLVANYRCYRFGVEESFAVAAVVLLMWSGHELATSQEMGRRSMPFVVALLIGSAGSFGLYRRFGFIYAAFASVTCAAAVPFQLNLDPAVQRTIAAAMIASVFFAVRPRRLKYGDDYPGNEYGYLQAAALAGVYLVLNLHLTGSGQHTVAWFYWLTYAAIWALPIAGIRIGVRDRDRELMDVSALLMLVTLLTNKPYLGWAQHTWDPFVLGILLIAGAVGVRRWLSTGPGGERRGFTATRLLEKDRDALSRVSIAAVLGQPGVSTGINASGTAPPAEPFGGGRSGGGGGGDRF
jgi:uncharacterized membrane protein YgcG